MTIFKKLSRTAVLICATALSVPAMAASETIYLKGSAGQLGDGSTITATNGSSSVKVSGWAVDSDGNVEDGALGQWSSGIGVKNSSGDNSHTIDNVGWVDFILLQFESSVVLETVGFRTGWEDRNGKLLKDTDASIGYGNLALPLGQVPNWDELSQADAFSGFSFIDSPSLGNWNQNRLVNPDGFGANTWIIAAAFDNPDKYHDGFKVKFVTFSHTSAVPEPATWMMLLLGFAFVGGIMRKGKARRKPSFA